MLFIPAKPTTAQGHSGYLAGRYRDGAYSDEWTDVRRCASGTFTAYAPACSCGWRGTPQPISGITPIACARRWLAEHLGPLGHTATDLDGDEQYSPALVPSPRRGTAEFALDG